MNINKKIDNLFFVADYKSDDELAKFIEKNFGNINYQNKGDSLLHLLVDNYFARVDLALCIEKLIRLGINPNIKDSAGRNFLQRSLEIYDLDLVLILLGHNLFTKNIDVNSVDNDGNTLVHSAINISTSEVDKIAKLLKILTSDYNFDVSKKNNDNDSILDYFAKFFNVSYHKNAVACDSIARTYYKYNTDEFVKLVLDSKEDDLVNYLNSRFYDTSISFFICQVNNPENDEVVEQTLLCIKKLLSIGCKPDLLIDNKSFIADAISKGYPVSYISQVCELANTFGLDINKGTSLLLQTLKKEKLFELVDYSYVLKIYIMISKYGYNNLYSDVYSLPHGREFIYLSEDGVTGITYPDKVRLSGFRIMFQDALRNAGISEEVILSYEGLRSILTTITEFNDLFNLGNDYQFVQDFCNFITEKYSMNIVLPKTIDEKDVLLYLREYMEGLFEDKLNRMLILKKEK